MRIMNIILMIAFVFLVHSKANAFSWQDLWSRKDEQGVNLLKKEKAKEAINYFKDPAWKGSAYYKAGDYENALSEFSKLESADGFYNKGNAQAKSRKLEEAISAYEKALSKEPDHNDAKHNLKLVKELVEKKKNQQENQNKNKDTKDQKKEQDKKDNQEKSDSDKNKKDKSDNKDKKDKKRQKKNSKEKKKSDDVNKEQQKKIMSSKEKEKIQQLKTMLRGLDDNHGGLLRNMILRDYLKRQQGIKR